MFASWRKSSASEEDSGRYTCIHTGYPDPVFALVNVAVFQPGKSSHFWIIFHIQVCY